jgi:hypothetical protein
MQKNFFNRFLLSLVFFKSEKVESKEDAFKRTKELLLSVKNREDLTNAVKLINHFNQKYGITYNSPEFIYFEKIVKLMRLMIIRKVIEDGEENDESQRICEIELEG